MHQVIQSKEQVGDKYRINKNYGRRALRTYADKHHHGKEEDILFVTMDKEIEKLAKSEAITGMYIEHDSGRLYMTNLEKEVNIQNVYKFAENMLNDLSKSYIEDECKKLIIIVNFLIQLN